MRCSRHTRTTVLGTKIVICTTDGGRRVTVVIKSVAIRRAWGEQELDLARPITAYERDPS